LARHAEVGLQGREPTPHTLFAQGRNVGPGLDRRCAEQCMMAYSRRATVRPVEPDLAAGGATEQLGDGDTKRLGFDIHEGALHARDGLGGNAARTLAQAAQHVPEARLEGPRILADEGRVQVCYSADDAVRRSTIAALTPAREALIRLNFHECPGPPARVDNKCLDIGDLHSVSFCDCVGRGRTAPFLYATDIEGARNGGIIWCGSRG